MSGVDLVTFLRERLDEIQEDVEDSRARVFDDLHWAMPDWLGRNYLLADVAAKRGIVDEHIPVMRTVEWEHDADGKGNAPCCPRCQNAEHSEWHPPVGQAGKLPDGFVTPYVLAPCRTLRLLAAPFDRHPDYDPAWAVAGERS